MLIYYIFSITIFLGSFLLFQVQPIINKYILPWFGGASFVWITSLLFFQILLLGGYFYSYLITKLELRRQMFIHFFVLIFGTAAIIITSKIWSSSLTPDLSWKLSDTYPPSLQILQILSVSVGIPYFILSVTSTLLQKWFSFFSTEKTPYSLYAVSNAGSLLGIATYPFLIEPIFTIHTQAIFWSIAFIVSCIFLFICIILTFKNDKYGKNKSTKFSQVKLSVLPRSTKIIWLFLPAISSIMLLSATNQLTQTVAPIPFLWLLPLGLYLFSFIICFNNKNFYARRIYAYIFLCFIPVIFALLFVPNLIGIIPEIIIYSIILFLSFMVCHGELYRKKPEISHLNIFYLLIALGSAIGSSIVALIAPILFKGLSWEFILGLFLTSLVAVSILKTDQKSFLHRLQNSSQKNLSLFITFAFSLFFMIMVLLNYATQAQSSIGIWRNFYGTLRITKNTVKNNTILCVVNGKIMHGCQYTAGNLKNKPSTYYGEKSGLGLAMQSLRDHKKNLRIGVIGLGAGTTAAYGKKGDYIRFYELNPLDIELAQHYFTYLSDSKAKIDIIQGDGRLSLEKEKTQQYDLLIIDAFTDDAIPTHLLTKEAFDLYRNHLLPSGIIAFHISTSYVNLQAPMVAIADHFGMHLAVIETKSDNGLNAASRWALLSDHKELLSTPEIIKRKKNLAEFHRINLWTDDYSNIFQILRY